MVEVNGKSLRFKVKGSKNQKKGKSPSKLNLFVPARIIGDCSKRNPNNVGSQDVEYESDELESSDHDDSGNEKYPKYEKFIGELLNKETLMIVAMKNILRNEKHP